MIKNQNKLLITFFVTRLALAIEFLLLFDFVYHSVMKEIPIRDMTVFIFLPLFAGALLVFHRIAKREEGNGTMASIFLIFWGICLILIPFLSIDTTLKLFPLTKINSHSLYLTYVLAGIGGLAGFFAGGFQSAFSAYARIPERFYASLSIGALFMGVILKYLAPQFFSYEFIFNLTGIALIICAIAIDKLERCDKDDSDGESRDDKFSSLWESFMVFFLVLSFSLAFSHGGQYFELNLKLTPFIQFSIVLGSLALSIPLILLFKKREFLYVIYNLSLIGLIAIPYISLRIALLVIIVSSGVSLLLSLFGSTQKNRWRNILAAVAILTGYYISGKLIVMTGELVEFTSRRFHYIPSVHIFAGALIAGMCAIIPYLLLKRSSK